MISIFIGLIEDIHKARKKVEILAISLIIMEVSVIKKQIEEYGINILLTLVVFNKILFNKL
ncbi:MAG: hypothetical protein ACOWWR_07250 [Eubacteriales bacterium]